MAPNAVIVRSCNLDHFIHRVLINGEHHNLKEARVLVPNVHIAFGARDDAAVLMSKQR